MNVDDIEVFEIKARFMVKNSIHLAEMMQSIHNLGLNVMSINVVKSQDKKVKKESI